MDADLNDTITRFLMGHGKAMPREEWMIKYPKATVSL